MPGRFSAGKQTPVTSKYRGLEGGSFGATVTDPPCSLSSSRVRLSESWRGLL